MQKNIEGMMRKSPSHLKKGAPVVSKEQVVDPPKWAYAAIPMLEFQLFVLAEARETTVAEIKKRLYGTGFWSKDWRTVRRLFNTTMEGFSLPKVKAIPDQIAKEICSRDLPMDLSQGIASYIHQQKVSWLEDHPAAAEKIFSAVKYPEKFTVKQLAESIGYKYPKSQPPIS